MIRPERKDFFESFSRESAVVRLRWQVAPWIGNAVQEHAAELAKENGSLMLEGGTISLQSESHPVQFRKVELMELEDE